MSTRKKMIQMINKAGYKDLVKLQAAIDVRLADLAVLENPSPWTMIEHKRIDDYNYEIEGFGDLIGDYNGGYKNLPRRTFHSIKAALSWLDVWGLHDKFDPEDDRVVVWQIGTKGHRKPVWHASGRHWPYDEVDGHNLEQGALSEHYESVYTECMKDY